MRFSAPQRREVPENIVPLINIVFLLLIFLMLAGTLAPTNPLVATPPASGIEAEPVKPLADIVMSGDGRFAYLGAIMGRDELIARVRSDAQGERERKLTLLADRAGEAVRLIALLDDLRAAGVGEISLIMERAK